MPPILERFSWTFHYENGDSETINATRYYWKEGEGTILDRPLNPPKIMKLNPRNGKVEPQAAEVVRVTRQAEIDCLPLSNPGHRCI